MTAATLTRTAALADAYGAVAAHLRENGERDAAILGRSAPVPGNILWPVTEGTEAERTARIRAFADANDVTADWHLPTGTFRAVVQFGPVNYVAFTYAEADVKRATELAERRMAEFRAALAEGRAA